MFETRFLLAHAALAGAPKSLMTWWFVAKLRWVLFIGVLGCFGLAWGQALPNATATPGERLSDWLLRNADASTDLTALHWRVPTERAAQAALRNALVLQLQSPTSPPTPSVWRTPAPEHQRLADFLYQLPVTGRMLVARADARWLQSAPAQDPVLAQGQTVTLLPRPQTVAVLDPAGSVCLLGHVAGAHAQDYLQACASGVPGVPAQWAWLVQPDGQVQHVGLAQWNRSPSSQTELAPGAWLWAPSPQFDVGSAFSDNLARFLSMQFPAEVMFPELVGQPPPLPAPMVGAFLDTALTASDWGNIGLLQTPTARMASAGALRVTFSGAFPYTSGTVMLQPTDWLEAGFRYTDVANRLYGPDIAGDQSYKDKSVDFKLRLMEEGAMTPQLAVGFRDVGGTGLFSSEYLVANKRWGNWDASLGIGWGYLGARGAFKAPLAFLGEAYKNRAPGTGYVAGQENSQSFFHGDASPFGGVQWQTDDARWVLKAELDGNGYQRQPQNNNLAVSSPFNFGLVYRYGPSVDFSVGWERGNTAMFGMTLHSDFARMHTPKVLDPRLPTVSPHALSLVAPAQWDGVAAEVAQHTGWNVLSLQQRDSTLTLVAESDGSIFAQEQVDRATVVLHRHAPASAKRFVVQLQQVGLGLARVEINRGEWVAQRTQAQPASLQLAAQQILPTRVQEPVVAAAEREDYRKPQATDLTVSWGPRFHQIIGGPDGFLLYEAGVHGGLEWRLNPSTWVSAGANLRLVDNYQNFKFDGPSNLPRVRTDQRQYVTTSRLTMPLLQITHVEELGVNQYASVYAGLLESEYAGVGGEWLYRPWRSPLAFGVDVNAVRQRGFRQDFALREYSVNTGHATLYWDTGWHGVQANLMVGQYLAGDRGATVNLTRVFPNGVGMGAWATKTNVSAEQFGEGSFDKGIFVSVPFDLIFPKTSADGARFTWDPLNRDGGARLNRSISLYDLTNLRDSRPWRWTTKFSGQESARLSTAQDRAYVLREGEGGFLTETITAAGNVGTAALNLDSDAWWVGGGLVLAAGLLDRPVDQWAQAHQGGSAERVANLANAVPYALAFGAGVLWTGLAGPDASVPAKTAITAAVLTLGTNLLTKYAVGRARPIDGRGPTQFDGFQPSAAQSSFTSNHVAMAFALATPLAQAYDQPWLYGLAASSALGRLQNREHWLSDTAAAGLLGYAIGSMTYENQKRKSRSPTVTLTDRAVTANWSF
jgi:membrane-associated phospholipid phosphatase